MWAWLTHAITVGVLFVLVANAPLWIGLWWIRRRLRVERRERDVQHQVWAMERQIWDERRSPEEIQHDHEVQAAVAGVRQEARRRLGLPEDHGDA
jgi:hypothetical protein